MARAGLKNLIRDTLWGGLPECYEEESIAVCLQRIYEYVYVRYGEAA